MRRLLCLVPVLGLGLTSRPEAARGREEPPKVEDIEKKVFEHRRGIASGNVVLATKSDVAAGGKVTEFGRAETEIWFSGTSIRRDVKTNRNRVKGQAYREVDCFNASEYITWAGDGEDGFQRMALVRPRTPEIEKSPVSRIADPRNLGLLPCAAANLAAFPVDHVIGRADRTPPRIGKDSLGKDECWKVEYVVNTVPQMRAAYWVDPKKDGGVVRIEVEFPTPQGGVLREAVTTTLALDAKSKLWFPERCVYQRHEVGELTQEERVEIKVKSLALPVEDGVFRLEGLGLPKGTLVELRGKTTSEQKEWDGEKLAPRSHRGK